MAITSTQKKEQQPNLRFPEFTDPLQCMPLSKYMVENTDRNRNNIFAKDDVLSVSGEFGVVNQILFQGRSFAGASVSEYHIVNTGDIIYTKSPLKANPYGIIKTNKGKAGIVSTLYAVYHPNDNVNSMFVEYYFSNDLRLNKFLKPLVNIGAKHDMKIKNSFVLTGLVFFPTLNEQEKIVSMFETLDDSISKQQALVCALEKYKRGVMQQLFSQKVRFKADDGSEYPDWEKKKLFETAFYVTDKINAVNINIEDYVSTENMKQNFCGIDIAKSIPDSGSLCHFNINDILMSNVRPYLKKIWLANRDGACNSDILIIRAQNDISPSFLYYVLASDNFISYVMTGAKGSKMPRGDKAVTMNYIVPCPCLEEQQKIADCLSAFDEVIDKAKQKLEAYKQLKKGLLQQMFV